MSDEVKEEELHLHQLPQGPLTDVELKLQLLHLSKDIIQQNAAMRWETHKKLEDINVDIVIKEARKLLKFVNK